MFKLLLLGFMLGIIHVSSALVTTNVSGDFAFSYDEGDLDEGFLCETNAIHQLFTKVTDSYVRQHGLVWYYDIRGSGARNDKGERYRSLITYLVVYIKDIHHYGIIKEFHRCLKNGYTSAKKQ